MLGNFQLIWDDALIRPDRNLAGHGVYCATPPPHACARQLHLGGCSLSILIGLSRSPWASLRMTSVAQS